MGERTLYIAGPMTGHPELNYPAFRAAGSALQLRGYRVLNPVDVEVPAGETPAWDWYMRRTLQMMLNADAVAMLPGWVDSRGAKIEAKLAVQLGIPTQMLDDWLNREPTDSSITTNRQES